MINILIPIDFSYMSVNAIKTAVDISKTAANHKLTIVHVYERSYVAEGHYAGQGARVYVDKDKTEDIQEGLLEEMKELLKLPILEGMNVNSHILADIDVEEILNHKSVGKQDLIVMGTHGMKGVKGFFIGSNAHKVMRESEIPVLTVKDEIKPSTFKKIVFVSDFTENLNAAADKLKPIIDILNAEVTLLKVITPSNFEHTSETRQAFMQFKDKHEHFQDSSFDYYNHSDVEDGAREYALENGIDMVCVATHGRSGLAHLLFGSVTEDIVDETPLPVLSVKM